MRRAGAALALLAAQRGSLSVTPPSCDDYDAGSQHSACAQRVLAEELEPLVRAVRFGLNPPAVARCGRPGART